MPRATSPAAKAASPKKAVAPASKQPREKAVPAKAAVPVKKANSVAAKKTAPAKAAAKTAPKAATAHAPKKAAPVKAAPAKAARASVPAKKADAPAKKAPAKKAGPVVLDKFHEGQRASLLDERATYTRHAESLQAEADLLALDREPGDVQFDEESGEGDTLAVERERDLALSAQARAAIEEIDKALEKIAAGRYGVCDQCGDPIPHERLKAIPYAALCVKCKSGGLGRR